MSAQVVQKSAVAQLRAKNQLTLPEAIVKEVGAEKGDRFRVAVEDGVIRLVPLKKSYYGAFRGLWPDNWMEELRKERDEWSRREIW